MLGLRIVRGAIFLIAAAGVGVGAVLIGARGAAWIERVTEVRLAEGHAMLDLGWLEVAHDGLVVTLSGTAPDPYAQARASESVAALVPAARIRDLTSAALPPPPNQVPLGLTLTRDGGRVRVTGAVHGAAMRERLAGLIAGLNPALALDMDVDLRGAQPPAAWGRELQLAAAAVALVPQARVEVAPGSFGVSGVVRDEAAREALEARLLARAGRQVDLAIRLETPPEVIAPFGFGAWKDSGGALRLGMCSARSTSEAAEIDALLARSGFADLPGRCPSGAGGPGGDWPAAVAAGLAALSAVPEGQLSIMYRTVELNVPTDMSDSAFEALATSARAALPGGYELTLRRRPPELGATPPEAVAALPLAAEGGRWLHVVHAVGGQMVLSGRLADGPARVAEALASAAVGPNAIRMALRPAAPSPDPEWEAALIAAIDAAAALVPSEVALTPGLLSVQGTTTDPERAGALHREIAARLPATRVRSEIRVDLPAAIEAMPPSPERCARLANEAVADGSLTFAPGSAVLARSADGALESVMAVLRRCPDAALEIGGHTDDRGSSELNAALSRGRAEAVRHALVSRGLDPDRLVSRGYGEAEPIAPNSTAEGRARNRRIAFSALTVLQAEAERAAAPEE